MTNKLQLRIFKKWIFFITLCIFLLSGLFKLSLAQDTCLVIPIHAQYQDRPLILNDTNYTIKNTHQIKFENLKFYLSNITLFNSGILVWKEEDSFHLIDFDETNSNVLCLSMADDIDFNAIQFSLGIDSLTNVSGALGGDLDPTKGMYWTWQNGYINFKLEGTSDLCNNPKNEFQYHLGGYLSPFKNLQTIKLSITNTAKFAISFDLEQFVTQLDLENLNHIMSPNTASVKLAQLAAQCFSIKQ
jgi:hypothetical protein